jgi:hypothetical protein
MKSQLLFIAMVCGTALMLTNCQTNTAAAPPPTARQKQGGNRDDFIRAMQQDIDAGNANGLTKMSISSPDGFKHDFKVP